MKQSTLLSAISMAALAAAGETGKGKDGKGGDRGGDDGGKGKKCKLPLVESEALVEAVTVDDLMGHCQVLQDLADASEEKNRHVGSTGHNATIDYVTSTLETMSDYWDFELQPFNATVQVYGNAGLTVNGEEYEVLVMSNSPSDTFNGAEMVAVANEGCEQTDYPAELDGKVALISRGSCTFSSKSASAGVAGALGAVIYNNIEDSTLSGTLGATEDPIGPHIPTAGMTMEQGLAIIELLSGEEPVSVDFYTDTLIETVFTNNVIATSKNGDPENQLFIGAHSDSVFAGPGINDNGSGSAALLSVAKALSHFNTTNQVRVAWWSAEEHGLLGAEHFVTTADIETLEKIRLYLNFDMIASPNYVLGVYDGSGGAFNLSGAPGSGEAQFLFEEFFESQGFASIPTEFSGRSDYGPFLDVGVPCGGLFTGAEQLKTEEEAALFGGEAGVAFDENYHEAGDTFDNLNAAAFEINGKAVAHAVASYAASWQGFPEREPMTEVKVKKRNHAHNHGPAKRDESRKGISMSCGGHGGEDI